MILSRLSEKFLPHLLGVGNKVIECYLTQDPLYYRDLETLSGKEICFYLTDLKLQVIIHFTRTTMKITYVKASKPTSDDAANLYLQGSSLDLLAFAIYKDKRSKLLSEHLVQFQGDLFLLEAVVRLFSERDFLANVPLPLWLKQGLAKHLKSTLLWQKQNIKVIEQSILDYAQEELKLIPSPKHFQLLQEDLLQLNQDLDRLEAKLSVYEAQV